MKQPFFLKPYALAWCLARPFLRRHKRLSTHFAERLLPAGWPVAEKGRTFDLWLHAASGGEAYLAREIVAELCSRRSGLAVLCTSMTEQGVEALTRVREDYGGESCFIAVNYFPLDEPGLMRRAVERVFGCPAQGPRALALLETEIWPGLLAACRACGVKSYIFNGRMTEGSLKAYGHIAGSLRRLAPDAVLAISGADAERFSKIFDAPGAPSRVGLMPNIKFDRALAAVDDERAVPAASKAAEASGKSNILRPLLGARPPKVLLLASVREEEEADLLGVIAALRQGAPEAALVIAPRHLHRAAPWAEALAGLPGAAKSFKRRSEGLKAIEPGDVVLWDVFGELTALYGLATAVFVGGSLAPLGGQNFLEPLAYGLTPLIGPSWSNFYWVGEEPFKIGLVKRVQNAPELAAALLEHLKNPPDKAAVGKAFGAYLQERRGGAGQVADLLLRELRGGA